MGHYLKMSLTVPAEYVEGFTRANNTFLYQLVFDPVGRKAVPLSPYPQHLDVGTLSYAGLYPSCPVAGDSHTRFLVLFILRWIWMKHGWTQSLTGSWTCSAQMDLLPGGWGGELLAAPPASDGEPRGDGTLCRR